MKNERGSTLIVILLVSLVLMTALLTIFSFTVSGTKRAAIRETSVVTTQSSISTMNEIAADFKKRIEALPQSGSLDDLLQTNLYESKLQDILLDMKMKYTVIDKTSFSLDIVDRTSELVPNYSSDFTRKFFTRYYEFSLRYVNNANSAQPEIVKTIKRNVYVSPTPSFLQYALGSEQTLHLNGASDTTGNVYGQTIYVTDTAKYVNELTTAQDILAFNTADTLYPSVHGDIVVHDELRALKNATEEDALALQTFPNYSLSLRKREEFSPYFYTTDGNADELPIVRKSYEPFVSVNFAKTFAEKLNALQLDGKYLSLKEEDIQIEDFANAVTDSLFAMTGGPFHEDDMSSFNAVNHSVYVIEKHVNPANISLRFTDYPLSSKEVIIMTDLPGTSSPDDPFLINSDLQLNRNQWLVVNGDLDIYSNNAPLSIQGNILVMGDVTIHGNAYEFGHEQDSISFYSTIYATGKATIYSTNITGIDGKQLVLLSQDDLLITRINEFESTNSDIRPMEAFLYTNKQAEVYGVGSLFKIYGGLFAKEKLTVNAIRQDSIPAPLIDLTSTVTQPISLPIEGRESQRTQASRFVVEYDKSVILDQLDSLPRVNELQVIFDDYTITNGK